MLYTDFTEKLLGLQDVNITNVEESADIFNNPFRSGTLAIF